jgi:hypothetical protein
MTNVTLSMLNDAIKKAEDKMKLLFENRIKNLEEMLEAEKKKNIEMETKNKSLEERIILIETKISSSNETSFAEILKKKEVKNQILIANTIELEDKRRREKNIVIYGLPVSNGSSEEEIKKIEREEIVKIFGNAGQNDIEFENFKRLKSKTSKPGPIVVYLKEQADRNKILFGSKKLRALNGCESIYMSPDLTHAERELDYQLRLKRNEQNKTLESTSPFRYAIRGSQVVKIKKFI